MGSENEDRLSSLPEEIQSHILSLMPTKFAVQTCILSKRWRYTWMSITNLDFDDEPPLGFSSLFIDRVLGLCKSSQIESLQLNFTQTLVPTSSVSNWIDKAVMLNVREVDLQYYVYAVLPSSLLTCMTLTKLKLCLGPFWECASVVSLPCLRTLDVFFTDPFASPFKLIAGSPILENLSLIVNKIDGEEDYIFDIPTLKRLKLRLFCSSSSHNNKLVLRVPKLEQLFFDGNLYSFFVIEDVSSLVEASFSFEKNVSSLVEASFSFEKNSVNSFMAELLKGISGIKFLSLKKEKDTQSQGSSLLKIISASPMQVFPNMERLELKGFWHFELVLKFLESSPKLKEIYIEKLQGSRWVAPKLVPACMLTKLTTIKFLNFKWRKSDVPFLKFLLRNAKVLKTLTINLEKSSLEEETRLGQQLQNVPRASTCCEIQFHRS